MQLRRARRLSSEGTMYHGACLLSVVLEHEVARFREHVPAAKRLDVHWTELPLAQRILDPRLEPALLLFLDRLPARS